MVRTILRLLPLFLLAWSSAFAATAVDPTKAGSYGAKAGTYKFAAKVDTLVTQYAKTEIWAEVWYPTGNTTGKKFPIVALLHGNHGTCGHSVTASDGKTYRIDDRTDYSTTGTCPSGYVVTPNHLGYDYVAKQLATNGFVVVSINANRGITAHPESSQENDPGLIQRRGRMILRHLQLLGQWNANGGGPASVGFNFQGKLDFSKITLFGHSRGGDGIIAAYNLLKSSSAWRSRLPGNAKIVALASMAPTDFQTSHPTARGTALSVLLPMCDSDVVRLSGIGFYDRSIFAGKDTAGNYKSVLAVWRTNHNGYNTQWQTDDTYQAPDHTCPGQGDRLFKFQIGLSPQQQAIGKYFLMALARSKTQGAQFGQLFNPAFVLPAGLKAITRIDRSYFVGTSAAFRRIVRFDGTCNQKLLVSDPSVVKGTCLSPSNANGAPAEHDVTTSAARVRWDHTGQSSNAAVFVLNNGTPLSLTAYKTLDMRIGPDCFLEISTNPPFKGCVNTSPTGGSENWANIRIYLQDTNNHFSKGVAPANYLAPPGQIAVSVPPDSQGPFIPRDPLGHAILSSLRIPMSAFVQSGFSMASVKRIYIALGNGSSRGGFYFGDVSVVAATRTVLSADADEDTISPAMDEPLVMAQATTPAPPVGLPFLPAVAGGAADATNSATAESTTTFVPVGTLSGSIVSVTRGSLPVALSAAPNTTATAPSPTIEFTLSTPEPLADTSDAGFTLWVGGHAVQARYFATGREQASPSIAKLVVPASAVESAPNGASVVVTSATASWQFGALNKGSIR